MPQESSAGPASGLLFVATGVQSHERVQSMSGFQGSASLPGYPSVLRTATVQQAQ